MESAPLNPLNDGLIGQALFCRRQFARSGAVRAELKYTGLRSVDDISPQAWTTTPGAAVTRWIQNQTVAGGRPRAMPISRSV